MASIPERDLDAMICNVGFHNRKATYIKATSQILLDKYNGDIPDSIEVSWPRRIVSSIRVVTTLLLASCWSQVWVRVVVVLGTLEISGAAWRRAQDGPSDHDCRMAQVLGHWRRRARAPHRALKQVIRDPSSHLVQNKTHQQK